MTEPPTLPRRRVRDFKSGIDIHRHPIGPPTGVADYRQRTPVGAA